MMNDRARAGWRSSAVTIPLVLICGVPSLVWFAHNWVVTPDGSWYLLQSWNLVSGRGQTDESGAPVTFRGPVFPGLIGLLMLVFGRDVDVLAWAVRVVAVVNPLLVYFLVRRISGRTVAGLLAAALVSLFGYAVRIPHAFNVDAAMLTVYLLAFLTLLAAVRRDSAPLSLLSGLLLGAAILTKETAFVGLPIAVFTALLLGWNLRGLLLHYAGVVAVCLPWWIRVWRLTGEVYLVGHLPSGLTYPVFGALAVFALVAVLLYRSGLLARLLASAARRRRIVWLLVAGWVFSFSVLLLSTGTLLGVSNPGSLQSYVTGQLLPATALLPALPLAGAYLVWKALRGKRSWELYLILLLLHVPPSLLAFVETWHQRQYMIPQTLLLGAFAALVVEVCVLAIRERGGRRWPIVPAALLAVFLLFSATSEVRALVGGPTTKYPTNENNEAVRDMGAWMSSNVPKGEVVFTTHLYRRQMAFQDDARHRWIDFRADCQKGYKGGVRAAKCAFGEDVAETPSQPTVWYSMGAKCNQAAALSVPNLLRQMEEEDAEYLMVTNGANHPEVWAWAPGLVDSGAFEVAHASPLEDSNPRTAEGSGLFLLKRTGLEPELTPTRMDAKTVIRLAQCRKAAHGARYAEEVRGAFPAGIMLQPPRLAHKLPNPRLQKQARAEVSRIYAMEDGNVEQSEPR